MTDFSQSIANFTNYGTYNYQFDSEGNEIVNPSSSVFQQVYLAIPLGNYVYNNAKIPSFYDPTFTEFIPVTSSNALSSSLPQDTIDQISDITNQNTQLQNELTSFIAASQMDTGSADQQSVENIITNLRIALGQGKTASDFQNVFPYLPTTVESSNAPTSSTS